MFYCFHFQSKAIARLCVIEDFQMTENTDCRLLVKVKHYLLRYYVTKYHPMVHHFKVINK